MEQQVPYTLAADQVIANWKTGPDGLTSDEAARRLAQYGPNAIKEEKRTTPWQIFIAQFKNFLILLLLAAQPGCTG